MDKSVWSVGDMHDRSDDRSYWMQRTPEQRLAAVEQSRQAFYGYDPSTARLQRVLEIAERQGD